MNPANDHGAAPERSLEQRLEALKRANEVRTARAELKVIAKRDLTRRTAALMLANNTAALGLEPGTLDTMKVYDLLVYCVPKVARVKANRMLVEARVSPSKTIAGLSHRQRVELLCALGLRHLAATMRPGPIPTATPYHYTRRNAA